MRITYLMIVIAVLTVCSTVVLAGPNRASNQIASSQGGGENQAWYTTNQSKEYRTSADEWTDWNHAYVRAGVGSYKTWVDGDIVLTYIPTGGSYARKYGLWAYDWWKRTLNITGCEICRFDYEATAKMTVTAQAALTALVESGDVFARATGHLTLKIDDVVVAIQDRECTAGTVDLELINPTPVPIGVYAAWGDPQGGLGARKVANDGNNPAEAQLVVAIDHSDSKSGFGVLTLEPEIRSVATARVNNSQTSHGWGAAKVKHAFYPKDGDHQYNDDWQVTVDAWDLDDPDNPVLIRTYLWLHWGDN